MFSPLAFAVSAFTLLFDGLRLLVSNWRLTLVQILPAVWVWAAMADLKVHVLHGQSFTVLQGPILVPIILAIVAITVAVFFLNAVSRSRSRDQAPPRSGRPSLTHGVTLCRSWCRAPSSASFWRSRRQW